MTIVLTPYWAGGIQKLKVEPQRASTPSTLTLTSYQLSSCDVASPPPPRGHLPAAYDETLHAARCLAQLRSKDKPIEKYIYLSQLKHSNEDLFYRLCLANLPVCNLTDPPLGRGY